MKKAILVIVAIVIVAGGFLAWKKHNGRPAEEKAESTIIDAARGEIIHSVEASGVVVSNLDVEIKCKASGEIISLPFEESDTVEKGELVLELDPVDEERNVKKATVSLNSAKARLEKAKQTLKVAEQNLETAKTRAEVTLEAAKVKHEEAAAREKRVRELHQRQLASEEDLEAAETASVQARAELQRAHIAIDELKTQEDELELRRQDVALAGADVESARINLDIAQQRLDDTKVYAPIDGVVTARAVQEGQIITSATGNVSGGTTVMIISDLSKLYIDASVDESDIGNVAVGQPVLITADAYPDDTFRGVVERIAPMGTTVSNVVTFPVRIEVKDGRAAGGGNDSSALKPEMTADVEIIVAEKRNVLTLPVAAVGRMRGQRFVKIKTGEGEPETREVETGISDGASIEIVSGLEEGEKVVIENGAGASRWSRDGRDSGRRRGPPPGMMMRH